MKQKKCKQCGEMFTPTVITPYCSNLCEMTAKALKNLKEIKAKQKKAKTDSKQNDKKHLLKLAQSTFNKFIRLRDAKEPCISCGYISDGKTSRQWHAGHYRPAGQNSALRFDELNVHKQCSICNSYKSGNLVAYRENLIKKIGLAKVKELEAAKTLKKWSIEELKEIIATYKQKINLAYNSQNSLKSWDK